MNVEQAQKTAESALQKLSDALAAGHSDALKKYLIVASRFHTYSFTNILLILTQRPDAERVAGYRTWQSLGRYVKKGERGIVIIAPMLVRQEETGVDNAKAPERGVRRALRFRGVHVFDVAQTDGDPLPEVSKVSGNPGHHLDRIKAIVQEANITLNYESLPNGIMGLSHGGKITLRPDLPPAEEFATLVHELAHELMHRDGQSRSKTLRETEAEAAAFAVCHTVGLDAANASADYIALYQGDPDLLELSLMRICEVAGHIITGLHQQS